MSSDGGVLINEARRTVERAKDYGSLIGVTGAGHIGALIESTEALLALVETHHKRLHAIELRQHGFDPSQVIQ